MANSISVDSSTTYWVDDDGKKITRQHKNAFGDVTTFTILEADLSQVVTVWLHMEDIFRAGQRSKLKEIQRILEIRD